MKKRFRWTLFKKTLFILLVAFFFVQFFAVYSDYNYEVEQARNDRLTMLNEYQNSLILTRKFSDHKYQLNDQEFLNQVEQYTESRIRAFDYIVLDKDFNIIHTSLREQGSFSVEYIYDNTIFTNTWLLENICTPEQIEQLDQKILSYNNKEIPVRYVLKDDGFSYLEIAEMILVDLGNHSELLETVLDSYYSKNIHFNSSGLYNNNDEYNYIVKQAKIRVSNLHLLFDNWETRAVYGYDYLVDDRENLLACNITPLFKNNVEFDYDGVYSVDDIEGYLLAYNYSKGVYSSILEDVVLDKAVLFIFNIVVTLTVCLVVSYSLSRRVILIEEATNEIINQNYDIHIPVQTSDEIGSLSHNINVMSQKIKNTVNDLNHELEHVKKLESVKSEFIANFTHEIKTPLSIINGYIELMDECRDENKRKEYLQAINKETDKINGLVLSMLNLTRLQSGNIELNMSEINFDDLIASVIDSFSSLIQNKKIDIKINSDSSTIYADEKEMTIVFNNFISNAIKHTAGHICINILDQVITIENDGSSITDEQKEKIWDTYVSSDREGTGLGLAINKAILDLHHFKYDVYNTDKGVCFKVICKKDVN